MRLFLTVWLLAGCANAPDPSRFSHWTEGGVVHFALILTPDDWKKIGQGEPLDGQHQHPSERTIARVSELIDQAMLRNQLCPGAWLMVEIRHNQDTHDLGFFGECDASQVNARTPTSRL